mmetsp:Transcript_10901/g.16610  ORF Transcript_10901/g.16610 Transcript_10901/m.16610 type:complete len:158 (-) Transcript_10901:187-660(-)|eukprot:CAMPEP_0185027202 /NCGR_PEP_ID=MMETSP1103-20130426/11970_1 /TAXON_ID=36769 /ORGANISM="Paraphysomonas bandaiensis, Strain Caron Lab Isolate" /LENGTH=157 /DNA_ID=CAMNT_0027561085 /DNA_START=47 /DNA_END=523 /DNA_ORIENTATION=+
MLRFTNSTIKNKPPPIITTKKSAVKTVRVEQVRTDNSNNKLDVYESESTEPLEIQTQDEQKKAPVKKMVSLPSAPRSQRDKIFSRMLSKASNSFSTSIRGDLFSDRSSFRRSLGVGSPKVHAEVYKAPRTPPKRYKRERVLKRMLNSSSPTPKATEV